MAPLFDTDLASERWSKDEWRTTELWEKIRLKERRRRNLWISGTAAVVIVLSAIPVTWNRSPKWDTLAAARFLASEIQSLKREAAISHTALRIRFESITPMGYVVEKVSNCGSKESTRPQVLRAGSLLPASKAASYSILSPETGRAIGLERITSNYCYDPLAAPAAVPPIDSPLPTEMAFAIAPTHDLGADAAHEPRLDRLSFVLFSDLGEVEFN